ncbi:MAG: DUF488 family protein [Candidatus Limnocylindrales bacterium]
MDRPRRALAGRTIFTIGHSTRAIPGFVALLRQVEVQLIVDVRSIRRSRANPQFDGDALAGSLASEGISYQPLPALGGRRHHGQDAPPSTNTLWRQPAFRDYADYAQTEPFRAGLDDLLALADRQRCGIMCAEAVWWRCHRRIIADYLLARGDRVEHIMGPGQVTPAALTPGAVVMADGTLRYPAPAELPPADEGSGRR